MELFIFEYECVILLLSNNIKIQGLNKNESRTGLLSPSNLYT